jgi:hypothetical protein
MRLARILKPGKLPKFVNMGNLLGAPTLGQSRQGSSRANSSLICVAVIHMVKFGFLLEFVVLPRLAKYDVPR